MIIKRLPSEPLRPFLKLLWTSDESSAGQLHAADRERLLPSGNMHLVFRLSEERIRIYDAIEDRDGKNFGFGVVAGLRTRYYVKDVSKGVRTVGAVLQPGVSGFLFGTTADDLSQRHTSLEDLWGHSSIREQLQEASRPEQQLDIFEAFLASKLPSSCEIHPAVAHALTHLATTPDIAQIVRETGYSHKHFIQIFRRAVGLSPRLYCRLLRFQQVLRRNAQSGGSWADIAFESEYSDQAHLIREFREFTGISPEEYRKLQCETHHVPIR